MPLALGRFPSCLQTGKGKELQYLRGWKEFMLGRNRDGLVEKVHGYFALPIRRFGSYKMPGPNLQEAREDTDQEGLITVG